MIPACAGVGGDRDLRRGGVARARAARCVRPWIVGRVSERPAARHLGTRVAPPRRRAWRGLVGRANGGMVVHLGVVMVAVALAAATSFGHRTETTLRSRAELARSTVTRSSSWVCPRQHAGCAGDPGSREGRRRRRLPSRGHHVRQNSEAVGYPCDRLGTRRRRLPDPRHAAGVQRRPGDHRCHDPATCHLALDGGGVLISGSCIAVVPVRRRRRDRGPLRIRRDTRKRFPMTSPTQDPG